MKEISFTLNCLQRKFATTLALNLRPARLSLNASNIVSVVARLVVESVPLFMIKRVSLKILAYELYKHPLHFKWVKMTLGQKTVTSDLF